MRYNFSVTASMLALLALPAIAQVPDEERARQLINAGQPRAALDVLEGLRMTLTVMQDRARAHLLLAAGSTGPVRCSHAHSAYEFASMASDSEILNLADKIFRDDRCPLAPTVAK
jgi:hypothetical protein